MEWYAVHIKSRHEQKVYDSLNRKSLSVMLPKIQVWSRRKDRKKKIDIPLFPGYLFVNCELTRETQIEILKTLGVVNILGYVNRPASIPEEQIVSIQKIVESNVAVRPHPYLKIGDKVIVRDGPLQGTIGYFVSFNTKKGNLIVSVDLLCRAIEVEIDCNLVEPF